MDQKKFCFECSTRARYLGLTFVCLAQLSARQKYRSIFELLLLLSDKRSPALCPGPGLLLWDSRVQTERAARPAVRPHSSGLPLLTTPVLLLQKRSSLLNSCCRHSCFAASLPVTSAVHFPSLRFLTLSNASELAVADVS